MIPLEHLLTFLRCPQTREPLAAAPADLVAKINGRISRRSLEDEEGERLSKKIDGALVTEGGLYAYPIRRGIPNLLVTDAIPLDQL